ncbi:MAG: 16S rRNA (cytosine(1402)-N(4))-methyltransferase RsmH [Bacteroidetes bacterium]|nr:16S rRNA (cytosine(1402)-N(4))-methyltransferase RsmH [Bacteroidota bacterium]NOG94990.1 16S rRNA (cytosine(1402)-N(4))-methyltransferase RsmH [Bacteroidota bacterium]GIK68801.1 MAG: ribosomal RNA small subunit methyltransferase H [Bacteroidota bacterium]
MMQMYHKAVLLKEAVEALEVKPDGIYVDATFGGGGHSTEILKRLEDGKLFAFDQDEDALQNLPNDERFTFIPQNFRFMKNFLKAARAVPVNGILADLGVSSHQFDVAERGFSTRYNGPLDMRMNRKQHKTAADIINSYEANELTRIFKQYADINNAKKLAETIVNARTNKNINTIEELKNTIKHIVPKSIENKYLAQVFQVLRIEVNDELEALRNLLAQSLDILTPNGRLVILTYHSAEDRMVKNYMRAGNFEGEIQKDFFGNPLSPFRLINKKPMVPNKEEIENNHRARSAKMRIAEKK